MMSKEELIVDHTLQLKRLCAMRDSVMLAIMKYDSLNMHDFEATRNSMEQDLKLVNDLIEKKKNNIKNLEALTEDKKIIQQLLLLIEAMVKTHNTQMEMRPFGFHYIIDREGVELIKEAKKFIGERP